MSPLPHPTNQALPPCCAADGGDLAGAAVATPLAAALNLSPACCPLVAQLTLETALAQWGTAAQEDCLWVDHWKHEAAKAAMDCIREQAWLPVYLCVCRAPWLAAQAERHACKPTTCPACLPACLPTAVRGTHYGHLLGLPYLHAGLTQAYDPAVWVSFLEKRAVQRLPGVRSCWAADSSAAVHAVCMRAAGCVLARVLCQAPTSAASAAPSLDALYALTPRATAAPPGCRGRPPSQVVAARGGRVWAMALRGARQRMRRLHAHFCWHVM